MTTIVTDDELFLYSGRARGKVVVLTGARRYSYLMLGRETGTTNRWGEWYWKGGSVDLREVWVSSSAVYGMIVSQPTFPLEPKW